jgi:hypothetical protein
MSTPKRKNNINVYNNVTELGKDVTDNRQSLLDRITKSDSYLPDAIYHDDLDMGMLNFVKENFIITTDGEQIPIIPKILTLQRWGEFTNNWQFSDDDGNVKLPFIAVVRKPEVQPGTNPVTQRTIPDRISFYYASVPTWNGTKIGADIYKIPQPVAVDISFDVTIVCTKFRDLNKFNKKVLQKFSSRQAYTSIKGHYIPVILESITDSSPMETLEGRRFYIQTYKILLLGYIIDSDEFEVKPAIDRSILMTEFISINNFIKKSIDKSIEIRFVTFNGDGEKIYFSVGEKIVQLFYVEINGILQQRNVDYFFIDGTSRITFLTPPTPNSSITVVYYKGRTMNEQLIDVYGNLLVVKTEFQPSIEGVLTYFTEFNYTDIIFVTINGLIQEENVGYTISGVNEITFLSSLYVNSVVGISYIF